MTSPAVTPDVVIGHPRRRRLTRSRDVFRQIVRRRSGLLGIGILVFFTILLNDYEGFAFAHNTGVQLLLAVADLVLFGITLTMPHWRGSPLAETRAEERLRAVRTTGAPGAASAPGGAARQAG